MDLDRRATRAKARPGLPAAHSRTPPISSQRLGTCLRAVTAISLLER
jgi:hypothetical protein